MSNTLIAAGTSIASCAGTVILASYSPSYRPLFMSCALSGLIAGALGLAAAGACKDKALERKDYVVISGAGAVGALAGWAAFIALATTSSLMAIGYFWGSLAGRVRGQAITVPWKIASVVLRRSYYQAMESPERFFCVQ